MLGEKEKRITQNCFISNKNAQATLTILKLALNFAKHKPDHRFDHAQHFKKCYPSTIL
jgi:hypothetical protein